MKIKIKNIKWDTDGEKVNGLPKNINIDVRDAGIDLDVVLSNWLSDFYGYCHFGFDYDILDDKNARVSANLKRENERLEEKIRRYDAIADFLWEHKGCFADDQQREIDELFDDL